MKSVPLMSVCSATTTMSDGSTGACDSVTEVAPAAIGSRWVIVPSWNSIAPVAGSIRSNGCETESSVPSMPESFDASIESGSLPPGYETRTSAVFVNGTLRRG